MSINDSDSLESVLLNSKPFELFVFNTNTGKVRTIKCENIKELGCTIGEGMMNSIKNIDFEEELKEEEEKVVVTFLQKPEGSLLQKPESSLPQKLEASLQENSEVTLLQKPVNEVVPPPPLMAKEKNKPAGIVYVFPPPSIYDISMESLTFQPRVLLSKYISLS